jgi:8-oxo-dGTP pyrophosphatase MutT (NUDIX family)
MRQVKLAQVIVRLIVDHQAYFLFRKNTKWNDWGVIGGHVEPGEEECWDVTATRESNEELAPLSSGIDFRVIAFPWFPITWGPITSRSANGAPTYYTSKFFWLEFIKNAEKSLNQLPSEDFVLIREDIVQKNNGEISTDGTLKIIERALLGKLDTIPFAWKKNLTNLKIRKVG